ncbi:MAG: hypothetical protein F6K28_57725 [Microcoleus sp. SIO2G3]|nr:hypothetical protein [Microcoleus sp. SIO2G3]
MPQGNRMTSLGCRWGAPAEFHTVQEWNDQHFQATFALTYSLLKREFGIHDEAIRTSGSSIRRR